MLHISPNHGIQRTALRLPLMPMPLGDKEWLYSKVVLVGEIC